MTHPSFATLIGSLGVALLLVAFFLSLFKILRNDGNAYLLLNLVGAALACWSSYLIHFLPFVVLEGMWAIVAAVGFVRVLFAGPRTAGGS